MKKNILFIAIIVSVAFLSCEKLAEEETPVCKDCYKMKFYNANNQPKDTLEFHRLCGGDVIAWDNFADSVIVADSTTIKYFCN
ncbi:MAG: hypothetical protein COX07_07485 [Bacteroidetes bacterium CG23_combo_of_CG06-09_8_20_14_all_32_9]|nr:MAG: hypothetical protein COX07_07485 [Bacteroidetes bacterium CG23_combo_of_CG06-09_8_20_14_all_32_9]